MSFTFWQEVLSGVGISTDGNNLTIFVNKKHKDMDLFNEIQVILAV